MLRIIIRITVNKMPASALVGTADRNFNESKYRLKEILRGSLLCASNQLFYSIQGVFTLIWNIVWVDK